MIPSKAMEAAEQAVIDAMIKYGPDGHIDGFHEITRAALEASAPHMLATVWDDALQYAYEEGYFTRPSLEALQGSNPHRSET